MVSSNVSTCHRKLLAVVASPFAKCAAAGGSASAPQWMLQVAPLPNVIANSHATRLQSSITVS